MAAPESPLTNTGLLSPHRGGGRGEVGLGGLECGAASQPLQVRFCALPVPGSSDTAVKAWVALAKSEPVPALRLPPSI